MIKLARATVLGGCALIAQACVPAYAPEQVFSRASRSVIMVYAADDSRKIVGRGSGVFVGQGLFVTNCHVIARGKVFGITAFVFSTGQNLNFAAPVDWVVDLAKKATGAASKASANPVELPPALARQWRHPLLK